MNDKSDIEDERDESDEDSGGRSDEAGEKASEAAAAPVAGERLAAARREQQLSVDQVAKELHLDEPKVRDLEKNRFENLGAPVFAKGHLRKYALLVGISVDEAIAEYESLNQAADELPVVGLSGGLPQQAGPGRAISVVIIVIVLAVVYWWFAARDSADPAPEPVTTTEPSATPATEQDSTSDPVSEPQRSPDAVDSADTVDQATAIETAVAAPLQEPAPVVADQSAEGQSTLTLQFVGDCWTEVTDARGERLFFALGREGRTANLVGTAPFSVVFGDADNVSLAIDGEPYAISATDRSGRMARLTISSR